MKKLIIILFCTSILFAQKIDRTISHKTFESIEVVQKLLSQNKVIQALIKLEELYKSIDNNRISGYEKAFVNRMFAYLYLSNEDYKSSIKYFIIAYEYGLFLPKEQTKILKNIAQLAMAIEDYSSAIEYYHKYLDDRNSKDVHIYVALASAYSEINEAKSAIRYISKAISLSKEPKLSWYEMLLALNYADENFNECIKIQKIMIKNFGIKKEFLSTLSSLYQYTKNEKKALSTLELSYDMSYFSKDEEYIKLAYLLLSAKLPQKCATLLEDGVKKGILIKNKETLRFLADAYSYAKEDKKALDIYKELAKLTNDGNVYAIIAQSHLNLEEYESAIKYFRKALNSETLKNAGSVYLLLGISYYEIDNFKNACDSLKKAMKFENSAISAKEWLKYLKG